MAAPPHMWLSASPPSLEPVRLLEPTRVAHHAENDRPFPSPPRWSVRDREKWRKDGKGKEGGKPNAPSRSHQSPLEKGLPVHRHSGVHASGATMTHLEVSFYPRIVGPPPIRYPSLTPSHPALWAYPNLHLLPRGTCAGGTASTFAYAESPHPPPRYSPLPIASLVTRRAPSPRPNSGGNSFRPSLPRTTLVSVRLNPQIPRVRKRPFVPNVARAT